MPEEETKDESSSFYLKDSLHLRLGIFLLFCCRYSLTYRFRLVAMNELGNHQLVEEIFQTERRDGTAIASKTLGEMMFWRFKRGDVQLAEQLWSEITGEASRQRGSPVNKMTMDSPCNDLDVYVADGYIRGLVAGNYGEAVPQLLVQWNKEHQSKPLLYSTLAYAMENCDERIAKQIIIDLLNADLPAGECMEFLVVRLTKVRTGHHALPKTSFSADRNRSVALISSLSFPLSLTPTLFFVWMD